MVYSPIGFLKNPHKPISFCENTEVIWKEIMFGMAKHYHSGAVYGFTPNLDWSRFFFPNSRARFFWGHISEPIFFMD